MLTSTAVDPFSNKFSFPKFESSQARQFVKSILKTIVHSRLAPFTSQVSYHHVIYEALTFKQFDISHDITHWTDNILTEPFKLYIYFCTENTQHIPVEIWTLQITDAIFGPPYSEDDINSSTAESLHHSIQSFLKLLPFYTFSKNSTNSWQVEYGITGGSTPVQKRTCFG
jgi:hypothetical protein